MKVIDVDNAVFFDVDDTLVMWHETPIYKQMIHIEDPYTKETESLYINDAHIKMMKRMKGRGKYIIVWSHAGVKWAKTVVEALELTEYVDLIMPKMEDFVDDLNIEEWALKHIYLNRSYSGKV